jgi:hypothetical protein
MRSNHGDLWVVKNAGGVSKWHVGLVGAGSVQVEPGTESLRWRRMQRAACPAGFPGRPGQLREVPTRDATQRPALRRGRAVAGLLPGWRASCAVRFVGLCLLFRRPLCGGSKLPGAI